MKVTVADLNSWNRKRSKKYDLPILIVFYTLGIFFSWYAASIFFCYIFFSE